ncbi:MAG: cupin domain-containing protein [Chitinophagaceae bacterium]
MPFLNFNTKKRIQIWDGVDGAFFHSEQLMFGYITVIKGAVVPEHQHHHEQWTHLIEGELEFKINGEIQILLPGMAAHIPSNIPHSAKAIIECKLIDCFLPVREDFVALEKQ